MASNETTLRDLTKFKIEQAFRRTVEEIDAPIGKLALITEDLYQKALEVPKQCFVGDEPIGKSLGVQWSDEFEAVWLDTFKVNLSIMLVNEENGDIIGFRAIRLIKKADKMDFEVFQDVKLRKIFRFATLGTEHYFDKYDIEEAFHFLGLGVTKKYRKRGIATFLMQAAMKFIGNLGIRPYYIKGEGTSSFSKKIFEKCGFDTVIEQLYDEYMEDGKVVFDNTGEHKSMKVYGLCGN